MKVYQLHITRGEQKEIVQLTEGETVRISAEPDTAYQILTEQGEIVLDVKEELVAQDLNFYINSSTKPELVIYDYGLYYANSAETVVTESASGAVVASEVTTATALGVNLLGWGLLAGGLVLAGKNANRDHSRPTNKDSSSGQELESKSKSDSEPKLEPKLEQKPDVEIATPTITLDDVTADNIINLAESKGEIIISGTTTFVSNGEKVVLKIGNETLEAEVNNGKFSVNVSGAILAQNNKIEASVSVADTAGNTAKGVAEKAYQVDTEIATPTITLDDVTADNIINLAESKGEIAISGTTTNVSNGEKVVLKMGSEMIEAEVNDGKFSANVSGAILAQNNKIEASVSVEDTAGNTAKGVAEKAYQVDTEIATPTITLDDVTADNIINLAESKGEIVISGTTTNVSNGEKVVLKIGNETLEAEVNNGRFSVNVSGAILAQNNKIEASISVEDTAGNTEEGVAEKAYQVDTELANPTITINNVTENNALDNRELTRNVELNGTIDYADDVVESKVGVVLTINGEKINATVNGKTWTATVPGNKLDAETENNDITAVINVEDSAGNKASGEVVKTYDLIKPFGVEILAIGDNDSVIAPTQISRISGKVEFKEGNIFADGMNATRVLSVNIKIGDKVYPIGFRGDEKTFFLDIPTDELRELNGQEISLDFGQERVWGNIYVFVPQKQPNVFAASPTIKLVKPEVGNFSINGVNVVEKNGKFFIQSDEKEMTLIRGVGTGTAKAGDTVTLTVNGKEYVTELDSNKAFSVAVETSDLRADKNHTVSAVLSNATEQAVDKANYYAPYSVGSEFSSFHEIWKPNIVNGKASYSLTTAQLDHSSPDYVVPYFIGANNRSPEAQSGLFKGLKIGQQQPYELKYYFMEQGDAVHISGRDKFFPAQQHLKDDVEWAYKLYGQVANIVPKKVENYDEFVTLDPRTGTMIYELKLAVSTAVAYSGGNLVWPIDSGKSSHNKNLAVHEIGHTFGLGHIHEPTQNAEPYGFENRTEFSMMSYTLDDFVSARTSGLRPYDLATTHFRFGVNKNARAGNDIYSFKNFDPSKMDGDVYIWDGNGVDTFDASKESEGVNVNLTPGSWVHVGDTLERYLVIKSVDTVDKFTYFGKDPETATINTARMPENIEIRNHTKGQAFIGYGTQIENLVGSAFNDKLTGNNADNNIFGGEGNDIIKGGLGNDYLDGGKGADELYGGAGDDTFVVDNVGDKVIELANEGIDTVFSTIDYTLGDNIENLTLLGSNAKNATGNALNNRLIANNVGNHLDGGSGDDVLVGGSGSDTLIGGEGKDIFVFESPLNDKIDTLEDFNPSEDKIRLSKEIFTALALDKSNFDAHIHYDKATGELSYQSNLADEKTKIVFAQLPIGLTLTKEAFIVAYPDIPTPSINLMEINYDNVLSKAEVDANVELYGYLRVAPHLVDNLKVEVSINGTTHQASVDKANLMWSLSVAGNEIRGGEDGEKTITAKAIVYDDYGNSESATASQKVVVDTVFDGSPTLTVNSLTADNVLQETEWAETITLSGSISNIGEANPETLRVFVQNEGGYNFYGEVNKNQTGWKLDLPGYFYAKTQSEHTLKISLRGEDRAGNKFEDVVELLTYQIESDAQANLFTTLGRGGTFTGTENKDIFMLKPIMLQPQMKPSVVADRIENFDLAKDKILLPRINQYFNELKADLSNFDSLVTYDKATGKLSYQYAPTYNIHIATFDAGLELNKGQFLVV